MFGVCGRKARVETYLDHAKSKQRSGQLVALFFMKLKTTDVIPATSLSSAEAYCTSSYISKVVGTKNSHCGWVQVSLTVGALVTEFLEL